MLLAKVQELVIKTDEDVSSNDNFDFVHEDGEPGRQPLREKLSRKAKDGVMPEVKNSRKAVEDREEDEDETGQARSKKDEESEHRVKRRRKDPPKPSRKRDRIEDDVDSNDEAPPKKKARPEGEEIDGMDVEK